MGVYVNINWFYSDNGVLHSIDTIKISDTISRKHLESVSKNFRFDDYYLILRARDKIIDFIFDSDKHKYYIARVVDDILPESIEIESGV